MEQLLHYVWKHKMFPLKQLKTIQGDNVEVIDTGLSNQDAGPDFFNAKIKIAEILWVGNVEIHNKASEWYEHNHHKDENYNNIILHVVNISDTIVIKQNGEIPPQIILPIPTIVQNNYKGLLSTNKFPPCYKIIPTLNKLKVHSWMNTLQIERLKQQTIKINQRLYSLNGDWEATYFTSLSRNFGFGINGDAFEQWAKSIPMQVIAHHQDSEQQIEAIFLGQAGLLEISTIPERHQNEAIDDEYFQRLKAEYKYLAYKFKLKPINPKLWKFLRLRPQNFPQIRISQIANLAIERKIGLSLIFDCKKIEDVINLLQTNVTKYWQTHYSFGLISKLNKKTITPSSIHLLIINTIIPMLFAYGQYKQLENLTNRALDFLEQLKPENNNIIRIWKDIGMNIENAGDSQALIQLKKNYCDKKDCLRCRIGYEFLKQGQ